MRKRKLLSKEKFQQIVKQHKQTIPEIEKLEAMAEAHRREVRSHRRPRKLKAKQQLKSTNYLNVEQFAEVMGFVKAEADRARVESPYLCRAVINEMLIILMAETGLRASEICNLKLKDLPSYHGKPVIEVECGKRQKSRTVGVSEWFASRLNGYVNRYLGSASPESWLFHSERGGPIKYPSIYSKVKRIGIKSGIWLYRKDRWLKSRLSPHKMRHTFGTGLLNASSNTWLVQIELEYTKAETSQIYARTLSEKIMSDMNNFHAYLWSQCE